MTDGETTPGFLAGGGEMGALLRAHDWGGHPLGRPSAWSQPLRTAIRLMLNTRHPAYLFWGEPGHCFYNDAYRPSIGAERHPRSLGRPARDVWDEVWPVIGPQIEQVMTGGGEIWHENQLIPITRDGRRDEVYWTYGYSPIDDEAAAGGVGGVFVICTETTDQVLADRRLAVERERQRLMLRQMPGFAALSSGPEHRFDYVNDAYRAIGGERDYVGRPVREVFPEIAEQGLLERLDEVYATGNAFSARGVQVRLDHADGDRVVDLTYEPIRDEAGHVTGIFIGGYDVTDRVRAGQRREALIALDEASRDLTDPADLSFAAAELLGRTLGVSRAGYGAVDHDGGTITVQRDWCAPGFASLAGIHRLTDYGQHVDDLRQGLTVAIADVALDPRTDARVEAFRAIGVRAFLDVPVIENGHVVGQMFVHSPTPRSWTDEDGALLRGVAARTRAAVARRLAERDGGASERRYQTLFDTIDDGFCVIEFVDGPDGPLSDYVHVEANLAYRRHTGLADVVGQRVRALIPDEAAEWVARFGRVLATGEPARFDQELVATGRHLELSAFRVDPPSRRQVAILFKDVTARRRADAELSETAERLRLTADHAEIGFWDVDPVNDLLFWPARTKAMFGISPDVPVTLDDFYAGLHPDDHAVTSAAFDAATDPARRALYDVEYRTIGREDGIVRWLAAKGRGLFDEAGRCIRVLGTAIDITARKRDEAELRDLNDTLEQRIEEGSAALRLYQNIVQSDAAPVVAFDHDYRITAFNSAHAAYFRRTYRKETRIGDVLPDTLVAEHASFTRKLMARALTGDTFVVRAAVGDPAIEQVAADISYNPLRDADGRVVGAFQHAVDVSAQLAAEAELALAQDALRQSQKMEAMGQLTGGVAHDFNNLLTPIVGALDLLARKQLGGEREQRLIAGAAQAAERARVLVQRLLAFARRQPLRPVAVDVAALVGGMAELIASTTGPQIKVTVEAPRGLPPAEADPNQLEMALLNLAVNARDAMAQGGTLGITATAEMVADDADLAAGGYIRLSVADTGAGMDEATLARAIEPFFSTKGIGKGTGLGLSMAHGLASQLGGALRIRSQPGLGTNVELWLPQSSERPAAPMAAAEQEATSDRRGTALLVDDEQLVRDSTADMLAELGYRVVEAGSAEEALTILATDTHVDIIVTDHLMPGMTGTDLARVARERRCDLPVLVVSGYADVDSIAPDLPRLTKPFRKDELAASLAAL